MPLFLAVKVSSKIIEEMLNFSLFRLDFHWFLEFGLPVLAWAPTPFSKMMYFQ